MADSVVSFLLENLSQLLKNEAKLLYGVGDQIRSLQLQLTTINQFLNNSKDKREKVGDLVNQIRDVAHEAADIIDIFVVKMAKHKRRGTVDKFLHGLQHTLTLRSVATDIERIKIQIATIYENKEFYGIQDGKETADDSVRRSRLQSRRNRVEEKEVVGFIKDANIVIKRLTDWDSGSTVVSIVGMGGLGKTTLAKKVYNASTVEKQFNCRAWVTVSQEFNIRDLLMNIFKNMTTVPNDMDKMDEDKLKEELRKFIENEMDKMDEDKLKEELRKFIEAKRCLIVLDDVWSTEVWDGIKDAFPNTYNGKVLITSRKKEVALHASRIPPYLMPHLNEEDSWELLARKAFCGEGCPKELEKDGRRIARKCKGLPLSLVVAGALLAKREKSTRVWSKIAENVNWYLNEDGEKCFDILALSYEELPPKLKSCFLYFGVFPEDFHIPVRQLIRLWVAEGFIKEDRARKAEDIAEDYLEDLVDRSLIIAQDERSDGGIKSCCIHDVLREFCIEKGLQENFLVHSGTSTSLDTTTKPRRLSIYRKTSEHISSKTYDSSLVRSLLCFGHKDEINSKNLHSLVKDFKLLRVLDLGVTSVPRDLSSFGKLILLRYMKLNVPDLREIPPPISCLPNLQTLDLSKSKIEFFQRNFWDMQQLRHLFISGTLSCYVTGAKPMPNLQTFSTVSSRILSHVDVSEVFPNLTNLGVICCSDIDVFGELQDVTSIKIIKIIGELAAQPIKGDGFLSNLTKITLAETKLEQSQFAKLGELPNLEALKLLDGSIDGWHLECKEGCFPRLQVFHVQGLNLAKWTIESGAMKNLSHLKADCLNLLYDKQYPVYSSPFPPLFSFPFSSPQVRDKQYPVYSSPSPPLFSFPFSSPQVRVTDLGLSSCVIM
ncbi:hypothetical protein LguiA_013170 [Lonicera macranthoides]